MPYLKVRAPLTLAERDQLQRLVVSLGPVAAARSLGVDEATVASAISGGHINRATKNRMAQSGWFRPEGNP